jgi:hypothetical protein
MVAAERIFRSRHLKICHCPWLLDLSIVLLDLDRHLRNLFEHWPERLRQAGRNKR